MNKPTALTECCSSRIYQDKIDYGYYCSLCDTKVDKQSGKPVSIDKQAKG